MHRRRFLAGASLTLPAVVAGCLNAASPDDGDDSDADSNDTGNADGATGGDGSDDDGDGEGGDGMDDGSGDGDGGDGDGGDGDGGDGDGGDGGERDSVPELVDHEISEHVAAPDAERTSGTDAWGLFVASRDAAETYYGDVENEDVATFVEETDFEAGDRLVYLQAYGPQTCYELVLDGDPFVSSNGIPTVEAAIERTAAEDEFCGDAMTPVEVLLRITFDLDASTTDVLEAVITGDRDQPEELTLEARR